MGIVVCVKAVYDPEEVRVHKRTMTLLIEGLHLKLNPLDKYAVEAALKLKEKWKTSVTALSIGPEEAEDVLRRTLAMGVNKAYLVTDESIKDHDPFLTAYLLSKAIKKLGDFDLVVCGEKSIDWENRQVGPQIAAFLQIPLLHRVDNIELGNGKVRVREVFDGEALWVESPLPAAITIIKGGNKPRFPSPWNISKAYRKMRVEKWGLKDLGLSREELKAKTVTKVRRQFIFERKRETKLMVEEAEAASDKLISHLNKLLEEI